MGPAHLRSRIAVTLTSIVLVVGAAGPSPAAGPEVDTAGASPVAQRVPSPSAIIRALQQALEGSGPSRTIANLSTDLLQLPRSAFTDAQWLARARLYRLEAARIIASKRFSVDISLVIPHQRLTTGTASTAATATAHAGSLNTRFVSDLRAVTREAAVSLACGTILDALAPDEKPFFSGFGESDVRDVFQQAVLKLVARGWSRASVERTIDYYFYTDGILDDANQFLSSSNATLFPRTLYVATRPAASRALWVYMRTCYATPRLP